MCKAFEETRNEAREQAYLDNIRNLMDSLKLSAEQAMAALKVPAEEQSKYLAKLENNILALQRG